MADSTPIREQLNYQLDYEPSDDLVAEAAQWQAMNPDTDLSEWVSDMIQEGML